MLAKIQNKINGVFNVYKNLPAGYFGKLLVATLIIEFFALVLSIVIIYASLWIANFFQFDITIYRPVDAIYFVNDLQHYFPYVNLLTLALFCPYLIGMIRNASDNDSIVNYLSQINPKKWGLFLGLNFILFVTILILYYLDDFSYGSNFFSEDDTIFQFKRWLYLIFTLIASILPILYAITLSLYDPLNTHSLKIKLILAPAIIIWCLIVVSNVFSQGISHYIGELLVVPFKSSRIGTSSVYLLQFALFFFIIPAKVSLLSSDKEVEIKTAELTEDDQEVD